MTIFCTSYWKQSADESIGLSSLTVKQVKPNNGISAFIFNVFSALVSHQ